MRGAETGEKRPSDFHTVETNSTVAEAPRPARDQNQMAGFLARESPQLAAFPMCRFDMISGFRASARRLQLRGQPWLGIPVDRQQEAYHIPSCLPGEGDHQTR